MDISSKKEFDLYKDIQNRTDGEVYLGIVGPVRTRKVNVYQTVYGSYGTSLYGRCT